jgi:DNA adenine methylase
MKPFLKWVGGKQKIIKEVLDTFPNDIDTYYEPFLGGGSVMFALLESDIAVKKICVNDINKVLIRTFIDVRDNVGDLIEELRKLKNDEESYYENRTIFNELKQRGVLSVKTSALFIYLNKTGFRGLYREGPRGMNVPFGHYKNPTIFDEEYIRKCSRSIKNVVFSSTSYDEFLADVKEQDFVYLDPPYVPETTTSFTKYNSQNFLDHGSLFDLIKTLPRFSMSNSNTPLVLDSFSEDVYDVRIVSCPRAINSKNPGSKTNEVIIKNII